MTRKRYWYICVLWILMAIILSCHSQDKMTLAKQGRPAPSKKTAVYVYSADHLAVPLARPVHVVQNEQELQTWQAHHGISNKQFLSVGSAVFANGENQYGVLPETIVKNLTIESLEENSNYGLDDNAVISYKPYPVDVIETAEELLIVLNSDIPMVDKHLAKIGTAIGQSDAIGLFVIDETTLKNHYAGFIDLQKDI